jgi:class 3 adenylate cyclase
MASRLSDHAKKGDILIGEATKNLVADLWPVHDRGRVSLKGIKEPLQIFSLLKQKSKQE